MVRTCYGVKWGCNKPFNHHQTFDKCKESASQTGCSSLLFDGSALGRLMQQLIN